eukprot:207102_1
MSEFYKTANNQYEQLLNDFNKLQKDLYELGVYFGRKNDVEFEYMKIIYEFAQNVKKVITKIESPAITKIEPQPITKIEPETITKTHMSVEAHFIENPAFQIVVSKPKIKNIILSSITNLVDYAIKINNISVDEDLCILT